MATLSPRRWHHCSRRSAEWWKRMWWGLVINRKMEQSNRKKVSQGMRLQEGCGPRSAKRTIATPEQWEEHPTKAYPSVGQRGAGDTWQGAGEEFQDRVGGNHFAPFYCWTACGGDAVPLQPCSHASQEDNRFGQRHCLCSRVEWGAECPPELCPAGGCWELFEAH